MKGITRKQFWALAIASLVLTGVSSSCSSSPQTNASSNGSSTGSLGTNEVEFWTMQLQPEYIDFFNQMITKFEQTNPTVKVRWVDVPWTAMESKILTAVSANTAPDVVNLNPDFAAKLAGRKAWMPLDGKITPEIQRLYLPKIWQATVLNGQSFGLPWYLTTRVAIYNTTLFKQAGISKPPANYAELAQVAAQIHAKTGKYAYFVTFVPEDSAEVLESFIQMGVKLLDAEGKAAFNTPAGKAAFQYWVDFYQKGWLPKEALTQGHRYAVELYQTGQTAILASGAEFLKTVETNAPEVAKVSASAPQITGETGKRNVAVMNLLIPRSTDQPEAALKFAEFVTNDENQLAFAKAANVLPSTVKSVATYEQEVVGTATTPVEKARAVSAKQLESAEILIPPTKDIKVLQKIIYDNLQAAMLDQKTVDAAIADAEKTWNQR